MSKYKMIAGNNVCTKLYSRLLPLFSWLVLYGTCIEESGCPTNHFDSLKRTDELNAGLMCLIQSYMYLYEDGRIQ